jgi:hypothetical protein
MTNSINHFVKKNNKYKPNVTEQYAPKTIESVDADSITHSVHNGNQRDGYNPGIRSCDPATKSQEGWAKVYIITLYNSIGKLESANQNVQGNSHRGQSDGNGGQQ